MEAYKRFVILALVLVVAVVANGQGSICRMTQDGLTACKPSVSGQSPLPPSPACCAAISKADLPCLCSFKNSALLPYLGIDPNMATQLPAKCNIIELLTKLIGIELPTKLTGMELSNELVGIEPPEQLAMVEGGSPLKKFFLM
ncbi:putative lipid-transfer protein DIR1 [Vitis vinifera]|uniref:Putative lipid-transfer protein DIR1 n=1 Tax=Vitis vinifera TaxID=29760 RepID=A0A438DA97_VITVI|nr:putative lipid-transfer protein DIR1 [Vitis vinifera]